ncbi:hypothetical protein F5Y19DRAFT_327932 [Xylariaceae sp. FL1651]|nr:hypothetical protein F5Y19DRAFT_327932 [Xylariaceae sp. FL1651]
MAALRHIQLPSYANATLPTFPSYSFASRVQSILQQELLAWKASPASTRGPPPPPTIISFTPAPTYTLGRRQTEPLSASELARLRAPLYITTTQNRNDSTAITATTAPGDRIESKSGDAAATGGGGEEKSKSKAAFIPTVTHAPRGGLATYHGPGQLVLWPVIDLHSPLHARLSVRDYACLLERTTIATLARRRWGALAGFTTENPGVWVRTTKTTTTTQGGKEEEKGGGGGEEEERKIAALGVHLRRHVTGLGVAINYSTPVAGPEDTNPWARIVACGLSGRGVTSLCAELGHSSSNYNTYEGEDTAATLQYLACSWADEFQARLKMHENAADTAEGYDIESWRARIPDDQDDGLVQAQVLPLMHDTNQRVAYQ